VSRYHATSTTPLFMGLAILALGLGASLSPSVDASPIEDRMAEDDGANSDAQLDPKRVNWRQLEFKATKLFVSARTQVDLGQVSPGVAEIAFDTQALGRKTTDAIRFQLADAGTLTREKQKHGNNPYAKLYRFDKDTVTMERSEPIDVDEGENPFVIPFVEPAVIDFRGFDAKTLVAVRRITV